MFLIQVVRVVGHEMGTEMSENPSIGRKSPSKVPAAFSWCSSELAWAVTIPEGLSGAAARRTRRLKQRVNAKLTHIAVLFSSSPGAACPVLDVGQPMRGTDLAHRGRCRPLLPEGRAFEFAQITSTLTSPSGAPCSFTWPRGEALWLDL
jgi:hypothetical protein